jgi:hypothetical protein
VHASTVAQCIRVTTSLVGFVVTTALDVADQFADRLDPPPSEDDGSYFVAAPRERA